MTARSFIPSYPPAYSPAYSPTQGRYGGGAFSPLNISGLSLWLDASDTDTIIESGGSVSQWNDKSGNENHITQATGANQPTTGTRSLNSLNSIDFNGSSDFMIAPTALNSLSNSENTVFVVMATDVSTNQNIFLGDNSGNTFSISVWNSGKNTYFNNFYTDFSYTTLLNSPSVNVGLKSGGIAQLYSNGEIAIPADAIDFSVSGNIYIGRNATGATSYFNGGLSEVLMYNRALSASEINMVSNYLYAKYALSGNTIYSFSENVPSPLAAASTVVTFGDSITAGANSTVNYTEVLGAYLGATMTNEGISGTVLQNTGSYVNNGRDRYVADLTGANKKDVVIILYGTNDFGQVGSKPELTLELFVNDYQEIIDGLISAGYQATDIILCSPPYIEDYEYNATFTGADVAYHEQFVAAVELLAYQNETFYADTYAWTKDRGATAFISSDDLHPNERGQIEIATAILNAVQVSEPDVTAPTITSSASFSIDENTAFSQTLTADETVTWSIVGGNDSGLFSFDGSNLEMSSQDYESPADSDTNNVYNVTVRATDFAGNYSEQSISVTVNDVDPEFLPTSISGIALWLDASDAATISDTSGALDQWNDKSGNSNHATASTTARPTTGTRTINGLNAIDFDGSNDFMSLTSTISYTSGYTAFVVVRGDDYTSDGRAFTGSAGAGFVLRIDNSPLQLQIVKRNTSVLLAGSGTPAIDTNYIFSARTSAAGNNMQINGTSDGSNATNPNYSANINSIGAQDTSATTPHDGLIGEIILYTAVLSDAEMDQVGAYLAAKWGISWGGLV